MTHLGMQRSRKVGFVGPVVTLSRRRVAAICRGRELVVAKDSEVDDEADALSRKNDDISAAGVWRAWSCSVLPFILLFCLSFLPFRSLLLTHSFFVTPLFNVLWLFCRCCLASSELPEPVGRGKWP